jgi:hypothetical protein
VTDGAATDCRVYYCAVCGPVIQEIVDNPFSEQECTVTMHRDIPHPYNLSFDEDENPQ